MLKILTVDSLRNYLNSWDYDSRVEELLKHIENLDGRTPLDEVLNYYSEDE